MNPRCPNYTGNTNHSTHHTGQYQHSERRQNQYRQARQVAHPNPRPSIAASIAIPPRHPSPPGKRPSWYHDDNTRVLECMILRSWGPRFENHTFLYTTMDDCDIKSWLILDISAIPSHTPTLTPSMIPTNQPVFTRTTTGAPTIITHTWNFQIKNPSGILEATFIVTPNISSTLLSGR